MSFTDDSVFNKAANAVVDAQIEGIELKTPKTTGIEPYDFKEIDEGTAEIGISDSVFAGLKTTGIATGLLRTDNKETADPITDPTFDPNEWAKANPEKAKVLEPLLQTDELFTKMADIRNETQMSEFVSKVQEAQQNQKEVWANPVSGITGMVMGIGLDMIPLIATGPLGGIARGAKAVKEITMAHRAAGALRVAQLAGAEGFTERTVQSLSDPLITTDEIMISTAIGTLFGGGLGGIFPRAVGGIGIVKDLSEDVGMKYTDDAINAARATRGMEADDSVGAARVPGTADVQVPGKAAGGLGLARAVDRFAAHFGVFGERWFRNPKRALVDMGILGKKEFSEFGLKGKRVFYDRMSRMARIGIAHQGEIDGTTVRATSAEDMKLIYDDVLSRVEKQSQTTYTDMLKTLQGKGKLKSHLVNSAISELRVFGKKRNTITQQEFEWVADNFAAARAIDPEDIQVERIVPADVRQKLGRDQLDDFMQFVKKQAAIDDDYYNEFGRLEVRHGLIQPEELIDGYRPQRWDTDAIGNDPVGFDNLLRKVFKGFPDEDFLKASYRPLNDDGTPIEWDGTFDGLKAIDEDLADDAIEMWDAGLKQAAIDARTEISSRLQAELKKFRAASRADIEQRLAKATEKDRKLIARLESEFERATSKAERDVLDTRIGKAERRIIDEETKLAAVRALDDNVNEIDEFIRTTGTRSQRKTLKQTTKAARKAEARELAAEARRIFSDQLKAIRGNILSNQGLGTAFVPDGFSVNSARFLRRSINLGGHRFDPAARKYLNTQAGSARRAFNHSVAPQVALRDITGNFDTRTIGEYRQALMDDVMEGFEEDSKIIANSGRSQKAWARDKKRAQEFAEMFFDEFTGLKVSGHPVGSAATQWMGLGMSMTTSSLLGGVALAQLTDIGVTAMAGGRWSTGLNFLFKRTVGELKQMDDVDMAVLLQGGNTMDATRFRSLFDMDEDVYVAGGRLAKARRISDEVGIVQGWANAMHVWNRQIRGSFGPSFARQMDKDFANWGSLSADLKRFYAKRGIGEQEAAEISSMLRSNGQDIMKGAVRVPKSEDWAELRPDLLIKYKVALRSAGDEALLDPGIADRPFLRAFPAGRMVLQFMSFMFKAGERYIPILTQELALNPAQSQVIASIFAVATMAPMVSYLQAARYGKEDKWVEKLGTNEGWRDVLWDSLLRSPLMAGPSSTITENLFTHMGQYANEAVEATAGVRPFRESASRFQQMQGAYSLLGALPSLALKSAPDIAHRFASGDVDKALDSLSKRVPISNIFYLQMIANMMEK
jgi:hypothetical protein